MRIKHLLILAATAGMALSCATNFEATPTQEAEIGFGTWAEQLTKAARLPGSSSFTESGYLDNDFAVYGYKYKTASDPVTVFNDVEVRTTDGTVWDYQNHRFWDKGYDSYTFFAISPASFGTEADGTNGSTDVNPQDGSFTTRSINFPGNDYDILVADKKTVLKGDAPYFNNYATVPLVFNHVASLVDIKVKKAASLHDATVTISAFQLVDIDKEGKLTVSNVYTDSHPVATWEASARGVYAPTNGVVPVSITDPIEIVEDTNFGSTGADDGNESTPYTPASSTILFNNLVVMPQTFRNENESNPQKIQLTYKISVAGGGDNEYQDVLYLANFDKLDDTDQSDTKIGSWDPGKHYTFYITIGANAISFSATITNWTEVSGYHYLVN